MRKYNLIALFLLVCFLVNFVNTGLSNENLPPLIPVPKFIKTGYGTFKIDSGIQFEFNSEDEQISEIVTILESEIKTILDKPFQFKKSETPDDDAIFIRFIRTEMSDSLVENGYILDINQKSIIIKAGTGQGFFYAGITLRQLILFTHEQDNDFAEIPVMIIADRPQYQWRGLMLDVARRYISVDFIKKYIDLMAFYKMNILHLHLTDDQGWRIQIDKYPELITIGSNLKDKDGLLNPGFYTKDDIREIIAFAAARRITIVPEIEFPGHCVASLNAYPGLSCTGGPFENESNVGETRDLGIERIKNSAISVISDPDPNPNYIGIAGNKTLIDGFRASLIFNDQFWQAFLSTDVDFILDPGQTRDIHKITIGMLHDPGPGIFLPKKVEFLESEHPDKFNKVGETDITINELFDKYKKDVSSEFQARPVRYVKVKPISYGNLPEWQHMFGNGETFIFFDEIWTE